MDATGLSGASVARMSGVSPKSVNNMLHGRHGAKLDHVEAVAQVFSLNLWQLILPDLTAELVKNGQLAKLVKHYAEANEQGRENISRVADFEARYNIK